MADRGGRIGRRALDEFGKGIFEPLVSVAREGNQRLKLAEYLEPGMDDGAMSAAPAFGRQRRLQRIQQQQHHWRQYGIAARLDEIHDGRELRDRGGGAETVRRELRLQQLQRCGLEALALDSLQQHRQTL